MSLFSSLNKPPGGSLFGSSNPNANTTSQSQPASGGFFASLNQPNSGSGQQSTQPQTGSLFASTQPQQSTGLFASTNQQQQPSSGPLQSSQAPARSLWQPGSSVNPREKTIPEQMQTLYDKWNPESSQCLFQKYFYNYVGPERVPYYGPGPGEDEQKWEDALAEKPDEGSVPVLCKGFASMAYRLRMQVESVQTLQARLHEINNSLDAQLKQHDLDISVRAIDARRRHVALGQRCLQLATKIQVLRNRGYVLDNAEEDLKKKMEKLNNSAFAPELGSRQEEIWARMAGIRERARVLQQESERAGASLANQEDDGIDEEVLRRTKKILSDYDSQISHLNRELEEIRKDFADWEGRGSVT